VAPGLSSTTSTRRGGTGEGFQAGDDEEPATAISDGECKRKSGRLTTFSMAGTPPMSKVEP
jgi:hypothetical protein